jgi:HJR/Mrr/RecB family endonuclease
MRFYGKDKTVNEEDKDDLTIKAAIFLANLYKGFEFKVGSKEYIVTHTTDKTLRIKQTNGSKIYSFKPQYFEKYGEWVTVTGKGHDKGYNLLRDIEGILMLDLLNINNKFHEMSAITKLVNTDIIYK